MADKADRTDHELLERPRRLRPSSGRRLVRLLVVAMGVAIVAEGADYVFVHRAHDCAAAAKERTWTSAVQTCQLELERTEDPAIALNLAKAQMYSGNAIAGRLTASVLLSTTAQADALYLLGSIALGEGSDDDAILLLEDARKAHRTERRARQLALDDGLLAKVRTDHSMFAEALRLADECITQAKVAADTDVQRYCHLIAARTLIHVGYWPAANGELDQARSLSDDDWGASELAYQRGSFLQEAGQYAQAIVQFEAAQRLRTTPAALKKAKQLSGSSASLVWTVTNELALAYSCAELSRLDDAERHLQAATRLDVEQKKVPERAWAAAQIAYRQHDLTRASALTDSYHQLMSKDDAAGADDSSERDDRIDVAVLRARIELERGDFASAERWAREAVEQAERVRGAQSALELRPWVLARRRIPYELLFTALARSGQVDEAIMVFDNWQGRTVQDALATPRQPAAALGRVAIAAHLAQLGHWLSGASPAAFAKPADEASVMSTMRRIDLLALIVADGTVWRLTANHGAPWLVPLTPLADIEEMLAQYRSSPTDGELANQLGTLLVPDEAFRATSEVLHVLVDGQLGPLPAAALRRGDTALITVRPIIYSLRLPERRCVSAAPPGHSTVLGLASKDIPGAVIEANQVAELLHTASASGQAATKAALFAAANDAVLHVASHAVIGDDGAALVLADGEISALEISARRVAPTLAVLSACDTATSDIPELAGALVTGFLSAGSQHVVATLRPIQDAGAPDVMTRFYREGGVADPARALAVVQAELAKTPNGDWPFYAVFGPSVCPDGAPELH